MALHMEFMSHYVLALDSECGILRRFGRIALIGTGTHHIHGVDNALVYFTEFNLGFGIHQEHVGIAHHDLDMV